MFEDAVSMQSVSGLKDNELANDQSRKKAPDLGAEKVDPEEIQIEGAHGFAPKSSFVDE